MSLELSEQLFRTMVHGGNHARATELMTDLHCTEDLDMVVLVVCEVLEMTRAAIAWDRSTETQFYIQRLPCFDEQAAFIRSQGDGDYIPATVITLNAGLNRSGDLVRRLTPMWREQFGEMGVRRMFILTFVLARHLMYHFMAGTSIGEAVDDA